MKKFLILLLIPFSLLAQRKEIKFTTQVMNGTSSRLAGWSATGVTSEIILGTNLSMTGNTLNASGGGGGIGGSTGTLDNAMLRADGTGGATLQSSNFVVADNGDVNIGSGATGTARVVSADGSGSNIRLNLQSKGTESVRMLANTSVFELNGSSQLFQFLGQFNSTISGTAANGTSLNGFDLIVKSGNAFGTGNNNAGNLYLTTGSQANLGLEGNMGFFTSSGSFGSGQKIAFFANAAAAPSSNPTGGFIMGSISGNPQFRTSNGIITTLGDKLSTTGGLSANVRTVTSNYTVVASDRTILVNAASGNITITLPASATVANSEFTIIRIDTASGNTVAVDQNGSETINLDTNPWMLMAATTGSVSSVGLVTGGTNWFTMFSN